MWIKDEWRKLRDAWQNYQTDEMRYDELAIKYKLDEQERIIAEARAIEEAEKNEFADRVARRVIQLLEEEKWITKPQQKTTWIQK